MKLTLSRKDLIYYLILGVAGVISVITIYRTQNPIVHILAMWSIFIVAIFIVKFDLMHPYFWFSAIFSLYSTAYATLYVMGARNYGYSYQNILFPVIALVVMLFVIGPQKRNTKKSDYKFAEFNLIDYKYIDWIVYALISLVLISSIILLSRGYVGKADMQASNDLFYRFGVYFVRFLVFFVLIRVYNLSSLGKKYYKILIFSAVAVILFGLCTGERDAYIRFFVAVLFFLFSINKIKKRHFIILLPICVALLVFSVGFKYYFSKGIQDQYFTENILETVLNADFYASGQNLQYLLDREWTKGYFGMGTLFTEIFYPILPGGMKVNLDYWFNYEVHINGWHGYAFTLVGTGYVIAGLFGIICVFVLVGLLVKLLYRYSNNSIVSKTIYLYSITIVMISCRGTLSSYSNVFLKEIFVACLIKYILDKIFIKQQDLSPPIAIKSDD